MTKFFIANSDFEKEEVEGTIKTFKECPNEEWGYRKISDSNWNVTHIRTGLEVVHYNSKQACTRALKKLFDNPSAINYIKTLPPIDEVLKQRKEKFEQEIISEKKFKELYEEFKKLTGISCPIDVILKGVDIIKLDEILGTPDNISMSDHLKSKYGDRASEIIDEMINL